MWAHFHKFIACDRPSIGFLVIWYFLCRTCSGYQRHIPQGFPQQLALDLEIRNIFHKWLLQYYYIYFHRCESIFWNAHGKHIRFVICQSSCFWGSGSTYLCPSSWGCEGSVYRFWLSSLCRLSRPACIETGFESMEFVYSKRRTMWVIGWAILKLPLFKSGKL